MSQLKEDALSRDGVVVTRAACPEAASAACAACLEAGRETRRAGRPGRLGARRTRDGDAVPA